MEAKKLNEILLAQLPGLLSHWLPGGKLNGREYRCGSIRGEPGNSLSVNIQSGVWKDFADQSIKGGDLISLYAAIHGLSNGDAIKQLLDIHGEYKLTTRATTVVQKEKPKYKPAPNDSPWPSMIADFKQHNWRGGPNQSWVYRNVNSEIVGIIARYHPTDKKEILPWVHTENGWIKGAMDKPRPLYNLPWILNTKQAVLIVEGEKCAEAAQKLFKDGYIVTTWAGGASAARYTDFSPIYGRKIVIWPDNDEDGIKAKDYLLSILTPHTNDLKVIETSSLLPKEDIADLIEKWDYEHIATFMKENHEVIRPAKLPEVAVDIISRVPQVMPPDSEITLTKSSDPVPQPNAMAIAADLGLQVDGKMMPVPNASNVYIILIMVPEFKDICYYDEFKNAYMTTWRTGKLRQWTEVEDRELTSYLQSRYGMPKLNKSTTIDSLLQYADNNRRHPLKQWLNTLVWDHTPRISNLFSVYCGAVSSEYTSTVSVNFMISMMARVFDPGCKMDNMVILEGAQGIRKSTFFKILVGQNYFSESSGDLNSKDFIINCQGKLLIEMAELTSLNKKDANDIKKLLSTAVDNFRPPYGKSVVEFPRQFVFVGSTNDSSYLDDHTGARRFWPIVCTLIDVDKLKLDREQLFAEAVYLYKSGRSWWEVPESALDEQASRVLEDSWLSDFVHYFNTTGNYKPVTTTISEIAFKVLKLEASKITKKETLRVARILKEIGYKNVTQRVSGSVVKLWKLENSEITNDAPQTRKVPVFPFGGERDVT